DKDVAADQISLGWEAPREIGKRMVLWLTPYQRELARYPLTLHASELPAGIDDGCKRLWAFVEEVLSHAPATLPPHLDHPQWNYHRSRFLEARHKCLSKRLGPLTETNPPPASLSELDKVWWKLDGLEKGFNRKQKEIQDLATRERRLFQAALERLDENLQKCE